MLKLRDDVNIKELEKYGFHIMVTDEELEEKMKKDNIDFYCNMAHKKMGNHFELVIENDECYRQLTIVPDTTFGLNLCISWQLDDIYELIDAGIIERVINNDR